MQNTQEEVDKIYLNSVKDLEADELRKTKLRNVVNRIHYLIDLLTKHEDHLPNSDFIIRVLLLYQDQVRCTIDASVVSDNILLRKIEDLELTERAHNGLLNNNVQYLGQLVDKTEGELLRTPNFGRKSLNEVKKALHDVGLKLTDGEY